MGNRYQAVPKTSHAFTEVATGAATLKTLLQVATPSTTDLKVVAFGVSFEGTDPVGAPGEVTLVDTNVAATVTSLTPEKWGHPLAPASLCVGGTGLTGYNATVEGTITDSRILGSVGKHHPQGAYELWFPDRAGPLVPVSRFLRIRAVFAVDVGVIPWIIWEEPSN
jgi:hypothetical protein